MDMPDMKEKISDLDKMTIELAKANKRAALANAEKAIAQNDNADLAYKYLVLQLYMKYNMTEADIINEQGEIVRGGALSK